MAGTLRWAVGLLAAETVGLVGLVFVLAYADAGGGAEQASGAVALTVFVAILAVATGLLTWSLARRRSWARVPAIVLNLLALPIGYSATVYGSVWAGAPVVALGLATAALLVAPATRAALVGRPGLPN